MTFKEKLIKHGEKMTFKDELIALLWKHDMSVDRFLKIVSRTSFWISKTSNERLKKLLKGSKEI